GTRRRIPRYRGDERDDAPGRRGPRAAARGDSGDDGDTAAPAPGAAATAHLGPAAAARGRGSAAGAPPRSARAANCADRDPRDPRRQPRLSVRAQGRALAARTSRALPAPARGGARDRGALLRTPRPQGGVLRPLHSRPAHVGFVARGRDAHAVALVPLLERPR